jgi:hypothetical protein
MLSTISNDATVHPMRHALAARRRKAAKGNRAVGFTPAVYRMIPVGRDEARVKIRSGFPERARRAL